MDKKKTDIFEGIAKNKIKSPSNNFFLDGDSPDLFKKGKSFVESSRRLNDYDYNLLQDDAYKEVSDDLFKYEYKIHKIEHEIRDLNDQILSAQEIENFQMIQSLSDRQQVLVEEYNNILKEYHQKSFSAKISGSISDIWGNCLLRYIKLLNKTISSFSELVLAKMPKRFGSVLKLKKSLNKLENINKSVDELVNLNIPLGEDLDKYDQLSRYIIKANSIQSEISRYMNDK